MEKNVGKPINKWLILICFVLIALLFGVRLIHLDQDPPPWGVSFYQPVDEGAYAFMAINEKTFGTINPSLEDTNGLPILTVENFIMNTLGNALNIVGFRLLGNNYYGLRAPYVLVALVNLLLFALLLNKLRKKYAIQKGDGLWAMLALILWMVLDFTFFVASRVVEPTPIRLLFVQLCALIYIGMPASFRARYLLLGLLVTFSVFLVYMTNVFLYLAVGATLLFVLAKEGKASFLRSLLWFVAGCVIGLVVAEAYYIAVWGTEAVQNALRTLLSFSENSYAEIYVTSDTSILVSLAFIYVRFFSANAFVYNLPMLMTSFLALPLLLHVLTKEKDDVLFFLLSIVLSFFLQSCFSYDTVTRKLIVIFPIVVCLLYAAYLLRENKADMFTRVRPIAWRGKTLSAHAVTTFLRACVWGLAFLTTILSFVYRLFLYDQTYGDYTLLDTALLLFLQVVPLTIFVAMKGFRRIVQRRKGISCAEHALRAEKARKLDRVAIPAIFLSMCACNVLFTFSHVWMQPEYGERDAMIAMAEQVDGKYVMGGGFQLGYTLYNDMIPIVHKPEQIMRYAMTSAKDSLVLEFEKNTRDMEEYFNTTFYADSSWRLEPVHIIARSFQTFGDTRNMALYEFVSLDRYHTHLRNREQEAEQALRASRSALLAADTTADYAEKKQAYLDAQGLYQLYRYPAHTNTLALNYLPSPLFADLYADVHGPVNIDIYGNVYGSIYGDVNATIHGTVHGKVHGTIRGAVTGGVLGEMD